MALLLLMTLPLLARRQFPFGAPVAAALVVAATSFLDGRLVPFSFFICLTMLAVCFLLGMLAERRQALVGIAIVLIGAAVVLRNDPPGPFGDFVFIALASRSVGRGQFRSRRKPVNQARAWPRSQNSVRLKLLASRALRVGGLRALGRVPNAGPVKTP